MVAVGGRTQATGRDRWTTGICARVAKATVAVEITGAKWGARITNSKQSGADRESRVGDVRCTAETGNTVVAGVTREAERPRKIAATRDALQHLIFVALSISKA